MSFKTGVKQFVKGVIESPMGLPILASALDASLNGNVKPWLRANGSDVAISAAPGQIQVDFANAKCGQTTILWRAPQPVLAQPQQLVPIDQLWANIQAAQAAQQVANAQPVQQPQQNP